MTVGETSIIGGGRPEWLCDAIEEALAAVRKGIDLHGVCFFPAVDMPEWHTGEWLHNGICDSVEKDGRLTRVPFQPFIYELRRWQERLNWVNFSMRTLSAIQ